MKKLFLSFTILLTMVITFSTMNAYCQYDGTGYFKKVTTLADLTDGGHYVVYGINGSYTGALDTTISGGRFAATAVTITNDTITDPGKNLVWKLIADGTNWKLYNEAAAKYCEITSNGTSGFAFNSESTHSYTSSVSDGNFSFISNHTSAGSRGISIYQTDFRPYASSGMKTINLYKKITAAVTTPEVVITTPYENEVITGTFNANISVNNFVLGTDGKLVLSSNEISTFNQEITNDLILGAIPSIPITLPSGTYSINAYLIDNTNDTAFSMTRHFTVDLPNVATPEFTPAPSMYSEAQQVEITCDTVGATIYYTTDGSNPSKLSSQYTTAIEITSTTTLKAIAYKDGLDSSNIASGDFIISSFEGLTCNNSFEYWTDNKPNCWAGSKTNSTYAQSDSARTGSYAIQLTNTSDSHKRFSSQAVEVKNGQKYLISYWVKGAGSIRTGLFDGRAENAGYSAYNSYNVISDSIYANYVDTIVATKDTNVAQFVFSILSTSGDNIILDDVVINEFNMVATPTISPNGGTYTDAQKVAITCETEGASIRYTLNGNDPTEESELYSDSITIESTTTLKAKAFKADFTASLVAEAEFIFTVSPTMIIDPAALVFNEIGQEHKVYVSSLNLTNNIEISASEGFTVNPTSVTMNTEDSVTVTFTGDADINGTLTFSSDTTIIINLTADIAEGMICNNSFEYWTNNKPNCWFGSKTNIGATNVIQSDSARTGSYAVQLKNTGTSHKRFSSQTTEVENGKAYQISYWVKGQGDIRIGLYDGRDSAYGYEYNEYKIINDSVFVNQTDTIIAENDTTAAEFLFSIKNTSGDYNLILDDVVIINIELAEVPTYYTITASAGENGTISPNGNVSVEEGESQIFTISPNTDYSIQTVLVDDEDVTNSIVDGTYTFSNVTSDHTISATFVETSISENELTNINIYPNPSKNVVNFVSEEEIKTIEILNITGNLIQNLVIESNNTTLNIENLSNGIYFVRINLENNSIVRRITVEK